MSSRAVFLDRDGVLNRESAEFIKTVDEIDILPGVPAAIAKLNAAGYRTVVITNQSGIARGMYTEKTLDAIHARMTSELESEGARIDAVYYCPHHPEVGDVQYRIACECRKPRIGMLSRAAWEHKIDLSRSFVIGDKASDIKLAENAGMRSALVLTGYGRATAAHPKRWPCSPDIKAENLLVAVTQILDSPLTRS